MKRFILFIITMKVCLIALHASQIRPIPMSMEVDAKKVELGRKLFFDTILSKDNTVSCASCHDLQNGGDDGLKFSFGINGQEGEINSPTVYNAVFNFRQFWDGRAKTLKDQASFPIENPVELGHSREALVKILKSNESYVDLFSDIYKNGVSKDNISDAIAEFEKTLITPNAPFDKYLKGDENAITQKEKDGYKLFKYKGCIICHNGVNVGGNLFNKFGIYKDTKSTQMGRYNITKREEDRYVFKVPSLRNIELTAPYMHDGRFDTLKDAVEFMAKYQLGRYMEENEIDAIVAFLNSLTGEIPKSIKVLK